MGLPRQAGGKFAPRASQEATPANKEASYGDVSVETVKEAMEAPHAQAGEILKSGGKKLKLPAIVDITLPEKNRTKEFWAKFDHLMNMGITQSFTVEEGKQSAWSYTVREVVKENSDRKYKFVRTREGLYLQRKA